MTATLTGPARGLMPPGWDPRPCVNKPAQWWDLGDEHNPRAIRYCRNSCPLLDACRARITDETTPRAQIRAGRAYSETGKRLTVCGGCDRPRQRKSSNAPITCGCPTSAEGQVAA